MSGSHEEVIRTINAALDARSVLIAIGVYPSTIVAVGTRLKAYCPFHGGAGSFKSLQVDEQARTCQCIITECRQHEPGSLVKLFARVRDCDELTAALDLARRFAIPVKSEALARIGGAARKAMEVAEKKSDFAEATRQLTLVWLCDAKNPELIERLAQWRLAGGDERGAALAWLDAARLARERGDVKRAIMYLDQHARRLDPHNQEVLLELSDVQHLVGAESQAWARTLLMHVETVIENKQFSLAEEELQKIVAIISDDGDILTQLADVQFSLNKPHDGIITLKRACGVYREKNELEKALHTAERLILVTPEDGEARRQAAAIRAARGDLGHFARDMEALAREALEGGNDAEAEKILGELLEKVPGSLFACETLAAVHGRNGQNARQVDMLFRAFAIAREREIFDRAVEFLETILPISPKPLPDIERLAQAFSDLGQLEHARDQYFGAATAYLAIGSREKALECYEKLLELTPVNSEINRRAAGELATAGFQVEARRHLYKLARALAAEEQHEAALALVTELEEQGAETEGLSALKFDLLLELNPSAELMPELLRRCMERLARNQAREAEDLLRRGLEAFPEQLDLNEGLLTVLRRDKREQDVAEQLLRIMALKDASPARRLEAAAEAAELSPADPKVLHEYGLVLEELGRTADAVESFRGAARLHLEAEDTKQAGVSAQRAANLAPDQIELIELQGDIAHRSGDDPTAAAIYLRFLQQLAIFGNPADIRAAFERVQARIPADQSIQLNYAEWLETNGDIDEAFDRYMFIADDRTALAMWEETIEALDKALTLRPNDISAITSKCDVLREMERASEAEGFLRTAAKQVLASGMREQALRLYESLAEFSKPDENDLETIAGLYRDAGNHGKQAQALQALLSMRQERGETEKIIETSRELLSLDPGQTVLREDYAEMLRSIGKVDEAAAEYEGLAESLLADGLEEQALQTWRLVRELAPDRESARYRLIDLLERSERWDEFREEALRLADWEEQQERLAECRAIFERLRARFPNDSGYQLRVAELAEKTDDHGKAVEAWSQAAAIEEALGNLDAAIGHLERLVARAPDDLASLEHLAALLRRAGRQKDSASRYLQLIGRLIDTGQEGLCTQAISDYERTTGFDWQQFTAVLGLYDATGAAAEANAMAERFMERANAGENFEAARLACMYLIERQDNNAHLREHHAGILATLHRSEEASGSYMELLREAAARGDHAEYSRIAGIANEKLPGDPAVGLAYIRALVENGEEDAACAQAMRFIEQAREDERLEDARAAISLIVERYPNQLDFQQELASLSLAQGKPEEAADVLRTIALAKAESEPYTAIDAMERLLQLLPESEPDLVSYIKLVTIHRGAEEAQPHAERLLLRYFDTAPSGKQFVAKADALLAVAAPRTRTRLVYVDLLVKKGLKPQAVQRLRDFATASVEAGSVEEALSFLDRARAVDSRNIQVLEQIASLHEGSGDRAGAGAAWAEIADSHESRGSKKKLAAALEKWTALQPGNTAGLRRHALFCREQGDLKKAGELFARLAAEFKKSGSAAELVEAQRALVELNPSDRALLQELAANLTASGDAAGARDAWLRLSDLHVAEAEPEDALEYALRAKDADVTSTGVRHRLIELYRLLGRHDSLSREVEELADIHLDKGETKIALDLVEAELHRLIEAKAHGAVLTLVEAFHAVAEKEARLLRFHALALEGEGREGDACKVWLAVAELLRNEGAHGECETVLRRLVALNPNDTDVRFRLIAFLESHPEGRQSELLAEMLDLAAVLASRGSNEQLRELYEKILQIDPDSVAVLSDLCRMLVQSGDIAGAYSMYLRLGEARRDFGDEAGARSAYEKAVELTPTDPEPLRRLRKLSEEAGNRDRARHDSFRLAELYDQLEMTDEAAQVYGEIAASDPGEFESRERLAGIYMARNETGRAAGYLRELYRLHHDAGNLSQAIEILHRLEKHDPENFGTLELLGALYLKMQDVEQATHYLKKAATRLADSGKIPEAITITDELSRIAPHERSVLNLRVDLFRKAGDFARAAGELLKLADMCVMEEDLEGELLNLRMAMELAPDDVERRERLALLLSDLDKPEEAFTEFYHVGNAREAGGDIEGAIDAFTTASMLQPDDYEVHAKLAALHDSRKDAVHASSAFIWLADHHERNHELPKSLECLERALDYSRDLALLHRAGCLCLLLDQKEKGENLLRELILAADETGSRPVVREAAERLHTIDPSDLDVLRRLVALHRRENNTARALELLQECFRDLLRDGDIERAQALLPEMASCSDDAKGLRIGIAKEYEDAGLPEAAARELMEIARSDEAAGQLESALELVERAVVLLPASIPIRRSRFSLLMRLERAEDAFRSGMELLASLDARDDHAGIIELCRKLIGLRPNEPEPRVRLIHQLGFTPERALQADELLELGELYLRLADLANAANAMRSFLSLRPDDTKARLKYIETYRQIGEEKDLIPDYLRLAELQARGGAVVEATALYERVFVLDPRNAEAREQFVEFLMRNAQATRALSEAYLLVEQLLDGGRGRDALRVLQKISTIAEEDSVYHLLLGRTHRGMNARGMAAMEFEKAATLYRASGNSVKETEACQALLEIDPYNVPARQALISLLNKEGRKNDALTEMERLAKAYEERNLPDLAEAEYRRVIKEQPSRLSSWRAMIRCHTRRASDTLPLTDRLAFATELERAGEVPEAMEALRRAVESHPGNIEARESLVRAHSRAGRGIEVVDDIITLAQLLVDSGRVDEGMKYFEEAMSVDPSNTKARDLLTATQAERRSRATVVSEPTVDRRSLDSSFDVSDASREPAVPPEFTASDLLLGALNQIERQESEEVLGQIVSNYLDILAVNSQNALVRVKLAEILEQMGRIPQMLHQLALASETFFNKNELGECVAVCERYLRINPADGKVRKRLNEASLKRDAYKAIESAILYSDKPPTSADGPGKRS